MTNDGLLTSMAAFGSTLSLYLLMTRKKKEEIEEEEEVTQDQITPNLALQLISQRRSIFPKQYTGNAVPRQVLDDMLEAARWAPSHRLTQPWHFVVFEKLEHRAQLGSLLASHYRESQMANNKEVSERKYMKKIANAAKASYIIAICVDTTSSTNALLEEVCSVACAAQNMLLVASAHKVGAYWSSSAVYGEDGKTPAWILEFLELPVDEFLCLGWMFVGGFQEEWPSSFRKPCSRTFYGSS